jgi:hypothetical protein
VMGAGVFTTGILATICGTVYLVRKCELPATQPLLALRYTISRSHIPSPSSVIDEFLILCAPTRFGDPKLSYGVQLLVMFTWFLSFSILVILPLDISAVRSPSSALHYCTVSCVTQLLSYSSPSQPLTEHGSHSVGSTGCGCRLSTSTASSCGTALFRTSGQPGATAALLVFFFLDALQCNQFCVLPRCYAIRLAWSHDGTRTRRAHVAHAMLVRI